MSEDAPQQQRYKRKRKKNFLKNAKGFGKKGMYGRGSQLDAETYQYFIRILDVYKEGFPSDEEKALFVNNVFQQTEDQEVNCCCNQVGCRVIQTFLPFASQEYLERYMRLLTSDLRPLCADPFASHVLQTLLEIACQKSLDNENEDFKEQCNAATVKISKFLLNNLEDYVWDTYGNHIIRTVLKNLGNASEISDYISIVKDYGNRLLAWPQFLDLPYSELTSGLLQVLLKSLQNVDAKLLDAYMSKLLNECFTKVSSVDDYQGKSYNQLPDAFMSKPVMMLLEICLEVASPKLYTQIYAKCFVNNLVRLSLIKNTNFSVQKLLGNCKEKSEFEAMFDELSESYSTILESGHSGVVLAVGQGCKRLLTKQGSFVQNIMKVYECYEPESRQLSIVLCLCKNLKYDDLNDRKGEDLQSAKLNLHGTLMVQLMLEFNKPIKIINSILDIDSIDLRKLFCNRMGSHIADIYVKSQYVGEKSRDKLFKKLQGTFQELAADKYGSRSFEAIWNVTSLKNRKTIMNELSHKDGAWSNTQFGRIISAKVNLTMYKRNKEEWNNFILKEGSKKDVKELFTDILAN
ncbi:hypothetical protein PPYR_01735 [Photinus pyralis]|nr:nucleolar protein 9 [Photinus pyralis]KAB0804765.1 hypothetical protein PPYR_01735 [Photinus pyralis]